MSSPPIRILLIDAGHAGAWWRCARADSPDGGGVGLVRVGSLAAAVERLDGGERFDAVVIAPPAGAADAAVGLIRARAPGVPIIVVRDAGRTDADSSAATRVAEAMADAVIGPAAPRARPSALVAIERERRRTGCARRRTGDGPAAAAAEAGGGPPAAVLAIEFDHFAHVVDQMGAVFGDRLLRAAAERLRAVLDRSDAVVRRGGRGLAALLRSPHRPEDVGAVAAGLVGYLARPFYLDGHEVHLTASIGVAVPPAAGAEGGDVDLATLLEDAEGAMLVAASTGGGRCVRRPPRRATTLPRPGCAAARAAVS